MYTAIWGLCTALTKQLCRLQHGENPTSIHICHGTHTHTPLWTSQSVVRASSSNLVPSAVNWLYLQHSYCGVFYTQKRSHRREWCLHLFCASKSINGSLLPYSQLKERSEPHTWNLEHPTIRSQVLSGKKMKSNVDYGVGSGDELSSWLYYHIKEHTAPVLILGQSGFKTFSMKSFQATAQLGCIWYILWPVGWNFATVWKAPALAGAARGPRCHL